MNSILNRLMFWRGNTTKTQYTFMNSNNIQTQGYATLNLTITGKSIPGDITSTVPVVLPYGFINIPEINANSVGAYLTGTTQNPIVMGFLNAFTEKDYRVQGISENGETSIYSQNFSTTVRNDGCYYRSQYNPNDLYEATAVIGEWMQKILSDIIIQIQTLYNNLELVQNSLNLHTHNYSGGITSSPNSTVNFGSINDTLEEDENAINQNKIFVTKDGTLPT